MIFAHPQVLFLLPLPILLAVLHWRISGMPVRFPFDFAGAPVRSRREVFLRSLCLLPMILSIGAIGLLANPQRAIFDQFEFEQRNVQFVMDVSGSMDEPYGSKTRHEAALDCVEDFVHYRKGDSFGLTIYGAYSQTWIPLTLDIGAISRIRPFLSLNDLPPEMTGGSATGTALLNVCGQLDRAGKGDRLVVLITDGGAGDISDKTAPAFVRRLRKSNVVLYTVLVGDNSNATLAREMSRASGGELFFAGDQASLSAVFKQIDQMSTTKLMPSGLTRVDWYVPLAFLMVGAWAIYQASLYGLRYLPW